MDICPVAAQRMFQAVVTQALIDATSTPEAKRLSDAVSSPVYKRKKETATQYAIRRQEVTAKRIAKAHATIDEARNWLLYDNSGFHEVVSLAGYDPDNIRERVTTLAKRGWPAPAKLAAAA